MRVPPCAELVFPPGQRERLNNMNDHTPLGHAVKLTNILEALAATIDARAAAGDTDASYTAKLIAKGPSKTAKKLIEEAGELGLALVSEEESAVAAEAADLLYHLFVALRSRGIALDRVADILANRQGLSGLEEKAGRDV